MKRWLLLLTFGLLVTLLSSFSPPTFSSSSSMKLNFHVNAASYGSSDIDPYTYKAQDNGFLTMGIIENGKWFIIDICHYNSVNLDLIALYSQHKLWIGSYSKASRWAFYQNYILYQ